MSALLTGLAFTTPLALAGLLALPLIWWLLRFTPPRPQQVRFPPYRLLLDLISREEQPQHTPWWVLLMRLAMAAAVILGVAGPLLNASDVRDRTSDPLLIIADDGWASAPDWQMRQNLIRDLLTEAQRAGAPTAITGTTGSSDVRELKLADAATTQKAAAAMIPSALSPKRALLGPELVQAFGDTGNLRVLWLSNGVADTADGEFVNMLGRLGAGKARVEVLLPDSARIPTALRKPELEASKLRTVCRKSRSRRHQHATGNCPVSQWPRAGRGATDIRQRADKRDSKHRVTAGTAQ